MKIIVKYMLLSRSSPFGGGEYFEQRGPDKKSIYIRFESNSLIKTPASTSMMSYTLPKYTKALTIQESTVPHKPTYHDAVLTKRPLPPPKPGEVAVKLGAVGFNHKDVKTFEGKRR